MATLAAPGISVNPRSGPDVTDHDLVQAVRQGDDHAFERLYHRYHRRISAYIFGMVHDRGRAEDLTQEVFVSALRRMRQTDRPIAFKAWVYEIAKNACIDAFRRSQRAEEVSIDAQDGHGLAPADHGKLAAAGPSPDAAVEGKQQLDDLCGAFGGLSDTHHQILVMRELEGLSYREIGERLSMSRPSVESTLFRARRRLTEEYEELRTGERCLRIQEVIGRAGAGPLGTRDQRRVGSHISRCRPCRRYAVMAGLDAAVLTRRPVRAKIAALAPLPAFLRRRALGGDGGGADAAAAHGAHHGPALAQVSMAAAQYGEPTMAGWMKASAVAVTVAIAGLSAGAADHAATGGKHRVAPIVQRTAATGGPVSVPATSPAATRGASRAAVRTTGAGTANSATTGAAGRRHRGSAGAGSFSGSSGAGAGTPSSSGSSGAGASGSGEHGSSESTAGGSSSSGSSTSGDASTTPAGQATGAVTGAVSGATGAVDTTTSGATGGSSGAPLVAPDLSQLTQAPAAAPAPPTAGQVVSSAADVVGETVGGQVGDAVEQTGAAVGDTVDQVTQSVTDAAGGLLGGQ